MYDFVRDMKGRFGKNSDVDFIEDEIEKELTAEEFRALKKADVIRTFF